MSSSANNRVLASGSRDEEAGLKMDCASDGSSDGKFLRQDDDPYSHPLLRKTRKKKVGIDRPLTPAKVNCGEGANHLSIYKSADSKEKTKIEKTKTTENGTRGTKESITNAPTSESKVSSKIKFFPQNEQGNDKKEDLPPENLPPPPVKMRNKPTRSSRPASLFFEPTHSKPLLNASRSVDPNFYSSITHHSTSPKFNIKTSSIAAVNSNQRGMNVIPRRGSLPRTSFVSLFPSPNDKPSKEVILRNKKSSKKETEEKNQNRKSLPAAVFGLKRSFMKSMFSRAASLPETPETSQVKKGVFTRRQSIPFIRNATTPELDRRGINFSNSANVSASTSSLTHNRSFGWLRHKGTYR